MGKPNTTAFLFLIVTLFLVYLSDTGKLKNLVALIRSNNVGIKTDTGNTGSQTQTNSGNSSNLAGNIGSGNNSSNNQTSTNNGGNNGK